MYYLDGGDKYKQHTRLVPAASKQQGGEQAFQKAPFVFALSSSKQTPIHMDFNIRRESPLSPMAIGRRSLKGAVSLRT